MTVYGYARVSTEYQDYQAQRSAIERTYKIDVWVEDTGTGRITQPNLLSLMKTCTRQDTIIVSAFDRLGRNASHVLEMVSNFKKKGISLISIREGIDINSSAGNMVFQMMCSIAEFESCIIADRVKHGLKAAVKRGVILGAPRIDSTKKGRGDIEYAIKLREKGIPIRKIQERMHSKGIKISVGTLVAIFKTKMRDGKPVPCEASK